MTLLESIIGLAASVVTIIGGVVLTARWFVKKLDAWGNALVDNSAAMRSLTIRVTRLEEAINDRPNNV